MLFKSLFKISKPSYEASFLRKQESSACAFNSLKALDPSLTGPSAVESRWDDEQKNSCSDHS